MSNDNTRIEVARSAFGYHSHRSEWCGWLRHHNIETEVEFDEKNDMVVYATPVNALAIVGMQVSDPARFGNCPALVKHLKIPLSQETAYDKEFIKAFYAKDATWAIKVAVQNAYMAGQPINGISP